MKHLELLCCLAEMKLVLAKSLDDLALWNTHLYGYTVWRRSSGQMHLSYISMSREFYTNLSHLLLIITQDTYVKLCMLERRAKCC